jgi:pimeloyl-ACP methyl ester carboxylesterase
MTREAQFAALPGLRLEYAWVGADPSVQPAAASQAQEPVMVFLHEGLGSVALWKDFPARLCDACGLRGLVYSRPGYGRSTPRAADERWSTDFMHRQALEVLPALLETLGIDTQRQPPWLFAHSDGASIALIHAAHFPDCVAGVVAMAPHLIHQLLNFLRRSPAPDCLGQPILRALKPLFGVVQIALFHH